MNDPVLKLFIKLNRCYDAVHSSIGLPKITGKTISPTEFEILEALLHKGDMDQQSISKKILKSKGNISIVLESLEKKGLIKRCRLEEDKRHLMCSLTDEGREVITTIFPQVKLQIHKTFACLNPSERDELSQLLKKLGTRDT